MKQVRISKVLSTIRLEANLSTKELAKAIGCTPAKVRHMERGTVKISKNLKNNIKHNLYYMGFKL